MKRFLRWVGALLAAAVVVVSLVLVYIVVRYPAVKPASALTIQSTQEMIARGNYLANHVTGCIDCHSTRDFKYFAGPVVPGTEGKGGDLFGEDLGFPGNIYAKNITPAGIGKWTDGDLYRTITTGVNKDGNALFPVMPYPHFTNISENDLHSIIAYIRTLAPIENSVPERTLNFPLPLIVRTIPADHTPQPDPDTTSEYAYGKYLVTIAACGDCHTPQVQGKPIAGMEFAGGLEFKIPHAIIRTANITPDEETGIGLWSKEDFVERFRRFRGDNARVIDPDTMKYQTLMPWIKFAGMTDDDLGAIYTHLRTLTPVSHKIVRYEPR